MSARRGEGRAVARVGGRWDGRVLTWGCTEYYPAQRQGMESPSSFRRLRAPTGPGASFSRWQTGQHGRPNRASAAAMARAIAKVVCALCG